ncbi:MAG: hypothetical protein AAB966_00160, partial [Patescibacteria group bacterium]
PFDYLVLLTTSVLFIVFLQLFKGERFPSFLTLLIFVSFYIVWGAYHHAREETVHLKNMIEYILIGFTVLILLILLFSI